MELKFEKGESVQTKLYRSNRTFMELKLIHITAEEYSTLSF